MAFEQKLTHIEEALENLAEQFKDKPNIAALISAYVAQVQDLENILFQIRNQTTLATAIGIQLDRLGTIVGEERQGRGDSAYRLAIIARGYLNFISGTPEELIHLTLLLTGPNHITFIESFPAHFDLYIDDPLTPDPPQWLTLTPYAEGDLRSNFGNAYVVVVAGTSGATGPSGTGSGITDGGVIWNFSGPGVGERIATLVLSGKPAGVRGIIHWEEVGLDPFGFFDDPEAFGFDVGHFVQAI